jgi:hypothetical protein
MLLLARDRLKASSQRVGERVGGIAAIDQRPESADHREDAGHVALVEQMDGEAGAGEVLDDPGLEIGESQDQVGRKRHIFAVSADVNAETRGFSRRTRAGLTA